MGQFLKVSLKKTKKMVKEFIILKMELNYMANLKTGKKSEDSIFIELMAIQNPLPMTNLETKTNIFYY